MKQAGVRAVHEHELQPVGASRFREAKVHFEIEGTVDVQGVPLWVIAPLPDRHDYGP